METKLLWIIPGGGYNLEDGAPITYDIDLINNKDHPERCKEFCEENGIDDSYCSTHADYARLLNLLGMIVVFNSGRKVDGKYLCGIYLPEELTENQISFLEDTKELFKEKYYEDAGFFGVRVFTNHPEEFTYKITDKYRNLYYESIIANKECENGQLLLYEEVVRQKENLENRKIG